MKRQQTLLGRIVGGTAVAAALALALAGCSSGDAGGGGDDGALTTVKVGNLVFVGTAAFQLGVDQGFFEDEGLDIQITEGDNPAALGGQLTSGQLDVAFTTVPFLATAVSEGAQLRLIAPVDGLIDTENPSSGILVGADSPVEELSDLNGKKIAIPALGSSMHLVTVADLEKNGADPSTVDMVQVPFPQMQQALESGNVDAIVPTEPFYSAAIAAGAHSLAAPEVDILPDATVTGWAATADWLERDPDTAAAFIRANNAAIEYAKEHPEELLAMMPDYTGLSADQIENMNFGTVLSTELNTESIQLQLDLLVEHGFIETAPTLQDLVYEPDN